MARPYSPSRDAGRMVAVSGQVGRRDGVLVAGGFLPELEQTLANLASVLQAAGLALTNVVKVNVYLTNIEDWGRLNTPYTEFFGDPLPARTALAVAALPGGACVEIEAWACRDV